MKGFISKESRAGLCKFFALEVPLRNLRPSVIYSVPCDRIVQRAYCNSQVLTQNKQNETNVQSFYRATNRHYLFSINYCFI